MISDKAITGNDVDVSRGERLLRDPMSTRPFLLVAHHERDRAEDFPLANAQREIRYTQAAGLRAE